MSAEGKVTQDENSINWIKAEQYESMIDIHLRKLDKRTNILVQIGWHIFGMLAILKSILTWRV